MGEEEIRQMSSTQDFAASSSEDEDLNQLNTPRLFLPSGGH